MINRKNKKAFTLIEILLWVLIVSMVMVSAFQALSSLGIWKIRLIQKTQTQKQALYFSEKLFEMIKYWWTIDFEEYFNRKVVNSNTALPTIYQSWHYIANTWFWNYAHVSGWVWSALYNIPGSEYYYCTSPTMTIGDWCYSTYLPTWNPQSYGQYSFQFIDYNSNADGDGWDENSDGSLIWDDDDEFLWEWPDVFAMWSDTKELYLINWVKKTRTFFRYNVELDPHHPQYPNPWICSTADNGATYTWSGCLWTIQYLKLEWRDWWLDHVDNSWDSTEYDGVIDTWIISPEFDSWNVIAWRTSTEWYWQALFPDNIHVTEFKVFPHPNVDTDRGWKIADTDQNVSEYVRLQLGMMPAWKDRKMLNWTPREYKTTTTINLTDIFTR